MSYLYAAAGILLIYAALRDVVETTLGFRGSGFLTGRMAAWVWTAGLLWHRRNPNHRLLTRAGLTILLLTYAQWTLLLWLGLGLLFASGPRAVVWTSTGQPADFIDRLYFAGFTFITLGVGDLRPNGSPWQLLTVVGSVLGFFVATLAITYLLSVASAVVNKRQLANYIADLGATPEELLGQAWDGQGFERLTEHVPELIASVSKLVQQHLAFPVLHYMHAEQPRSSFAPRLAALDEALGILQHAIRGCDAAKRQVEPLRRSIANLLQALNRDFTSLSDEPPPPGDLQGLRRRGLPVRPQQEYVDALAGEARRRRMLRGLVENHGWTWHDVAAPEDRR